MTGVRLRIHPLFVILLGLLIVIGRSSDVVILLLVLASHELAHIIVARWLGTTVDAVDILPFGGQIHMPDLSGADPFAELAIAAAGPFNNLVLAGLAVVVSHGLSLDPQRLNFFIDSNLAMGLVNLLPALPLDGGRIYRALSAPRVGQHVASGWAVASARVIAAGFVVVAVVFWLIGLNGLTPAVFGVFLWLAADREARQIGSEWTWSFERRQEYLRTEGIVTEHSLVVMEHVRVRDVLRRMFPRRYHQVVVLAGDMSRLGILTEIDVYRALFEHGLTVSVGELVRSKM